MYDVDDAESVPIHLFSRKGMDDVFEGTDPRCTGFMYTVVGETKQWHSTTILNSP